MLSGVTGRAKAAPPLKDFEPGQVIVELHPNSANQSTLNKINADYGTDTLDETLKGSGVYLLKLPAGSSVDKTVKKMATDKRLLYAESNLVARLPEAVARQRAWGITNVEPTSEQYGPSALNLSVLNLSDAHAISQGEGATVAVLDTGVQVDHPALAASVKGIWRHDFVDNDNDPSEPPVGADADEDMMEGHGTHVAGIVHLVAPEAKIMPLRVLDKKGYGDVFTIAKAISEAKSHGAHVINLSLGTPTESKLLRKVIDDAIKSGVLVAAAAGNSNSSDPHYPAAGNGEAAPSKGLMAVTSVKTDGQKSVFANYGRWVDIAAPGEDIWSTFPGSAYAAWSGTSMATPIVSGQAALIHAVDGSLDPAGVAEKISCSAQLLGAKDLGAGRADVGASVAASLAKGRCSPKGKGVK